MVYWEWLVRESRVYDAQYNPGGIMMALKTIKKVILVTVVLTIMLSLASQGFALGNKKMLEAWYMNIKIRSNGQEVYTDTQPFIVDGITYVPVRMLADIFNKNVKWDQTNYTVLISDKHDASTDSLMHQLHMKDMEIAQLKTRLSQLEPTTGSYIMTNMDYLEDDLNHAYDKYRNISFEIVLSGDRNDITVKINFDLNDHKTEWNRLTTSNIKTYLQNICDEILDEFPKANIDGYFKDTSGSTSRKLYKFDTSARGTVILNASNEDDLGDLEDDLDDFCYDYFDDIRLSLKLVGDEDDITYNIYIDYERYDDEWDDLHNNEIRWFMEDVFEKIEDEFEDADIVGYVIDEDSRDKLARYDPDRSTKFYRYK